MTMKTSDHIIGPSRGELAHALDYANAGASRVDDCRDYLMTVYELCAADDMPDAAMVVSQSQLETADPYGWQSFWWVDRLNPAGMGITGDPDQNEESHTFKTGEEAARGHVSHLLLYATGAIDRGGLTPDDDPRYDAYVDAYGHTAQATTIQGLAGTWAVDRDYASKICERSKVLYGDLPDQGASNMGTTVFQFDKVMTTRNLGTLTKPAVITCHNNGNPSSDRFDEAAFVQSGGGSSGVLYHFAIDAGGVVQIAKLDAKGVHAGNSQGNATSIAYEMCVGSEPWSQVKENTAQLMAEIVTNSRGILDYGSFAAADFSLDRVKEHRDWPGANPACPERLIQTDGGVEKILARSREIVAAITNGTPSTPSTDYPDGMDEGLAERLFGSVKGEDGRTYSFNPEGVISGLWLAEGERAGQFPELQEVWVYADGRKYFVFASGLTIWQANEAAPAKVLK